jgi:hypothetical protein
VARGFTPTCMARKEIRAMRGIGTAALVATDASTGCDHV